MSRVRGRAEASAVPVLAVERVPGGLRYHLVGAGGPVSEPVVQPLDDDSLAALQRGGDELLHAVEHAAFPREAEARGQVLYRSLVPPALQAPLERVEGPLLVASAIGGIPWELLHDGGEFWGVRYALGRRLLDQPAETTAAPARGPRPRILVIGSDARGDLPFVAAEVETLCVALAAIGDVVCVNGPLATFDAVTAALREGFDVVHYTGHVDATAGGESALVLAGETSLAAGVVQSTVTGRPLVFVNGCRSTRPHANGAGAASIAAVAHGFLRGGAAALIGTANDIGDRFAAVLARRFYHHAAGGVPIGEALRRARIDCRSDPATAGSPAWLSFALYGDPTHVPFGPRAAVVAPRTARGAPLRWRRAWMAVVLAIVIAGAGVAVLHRLQGRRHVVLGVMGVEVRAGHVPQWMRDFTRDGIITALAEVATVDVFSREKIDFLCAKQGVCGIAAAERLGMEAMLTPTLTVSGETVALELQVVDVARNGVLAASERVQGSRDALIGLQNAAVLRVLEALRVTPTAAERDRILHARTDAELQAYHLLTETLGHGTAPPTTVPAIPAPGSLRQGPTRGVAYAQELSPDEAAVRTALETYRARLEAKDVAGVAALQTVTTAEQRAALERYFGNARDLSIRFTRIDVLVAGDDAVATVSREDAFHDATTEKPVHLRVRLTLRLARRDGAWRVALPVDGP